MQRADEQALGVDCERDVVVVDELTDEPRLSAAPGARQVRVRGTGEQQRAGVADEQLAVRLERRWCRLMAGVIGDGELDGLAAARGADRDDAEFAVMPGADFGAAVSLCPGGEQRDGLDAKDRGAVVSRVRDLVGEVMAAPGAALGDQARVGAARDRAAQAPALACAADVVVDGAVGQVDDLPAGGVQCPDLSSVVVAEEAAVATVERGGGLLEHGVVIRCRSRAAGARSSPGRGSGRRAASATPAVRRPRRRAWGSCGCWSARRCAGG